MAEGTAVGLEQPCRIHASVPTGLEAVAVEEYTEVFCRRPENSSRGRITFDLPSLAELAQVDNLKSVDNFWVDAGQFPDFCRDEHSVLERLADLPQDDSLIQWNTPLKVWRYYRQVVNPEAVASGDIPVTFRVTCTRSGRKHCFSSMEAAGALGAGLVRRFGWKVQMKDADLEVLLAVSGDSVGVGLALNKESKFKRNIAHFGPTTLRSTIAYGLLRMGAIQCGDIVVDPFCGGGSISVEGALGWRGSFHLAGDLHDLAPPRANANVCALRGRGLHVPVDTLQWDACSLPLRTGSVDVVVTDLPFGKRSGSHHGNWVLYPRALEELGRVCRPVTGRAVLLTHDNKAFSKALTLDRLWKRMLTRWINVGGLTAAVYLLHRNDMI